MREVSPILRGRPPFGSMLFGRVTERFTSGLKWGSSMKMFERTIARFVAIGMSRTFTVLVAHGRY